MTTNNFFQDNNYKMPSTDNYMKFKEGENTFRVLSSAITGYEYFNTENKPVRSKLPLTRHLALRRAERLNTFGRSVYGTTLTSEFKSYSLPRREL